jgi:hypothetical protein
MTQIVVNHLTRMTHPTICLAGVEVDSKQHLRPVTTPAQPLTREMLSEAGGPFQIGARIELGELEARPDPPETEDHLCDPRRAENLGCLTDEDYLTLIDSVSERTLRGAFGVDLERHGRTYAIDPGRGKCSLACVRARRPTDLEIDGFGKLRLLFNDTPKPASVKIADLRFYEADQTTRRSDVFVDVRRRLLRGVGVWVMFGLARAWKASNDDVERHWLQVNGLCLEDSPLGSMP